jgi:hypothetical protein
MEDLPYEMLNEILSRLDKPSLFQASNVCKLLRQQALTHVVSITTGRQLGIVAGNGDRLSIIKSKHNEYRIDWGVLDSLEGHEDLKKIIMPVIPEYFEFGLRGACQGGHKDLVELMIIKGAKEFDEGLTYACRGGHKDLAELMIIKGARDYDMGLYFACGRHKDLVDLMIAKGAKKCYCGKSIEEH